MENIEKAVSEIAVSLRAQRYYARNFCEQRRFLTRAVPMARAHAARRELSRTGVSML